MTNTSVQNNNNQKGFTLLLASLIASLMLSIGLSMALIALKETTLSSFGRDSQYTFYVADGGSECAEYWYYRDAFESTTTLSGAKCNGQSIVIGGKPDPSNSITEFEFVQKVKQREDSEDENKRCVRVRVTKSTVAGKNGTSINSQGYSTDCGVNTSRKLERAVEINIDLGN